MINMRMVIVGIEAYTLIEHYLRLAGVSLSNELFIFGLDEGGKHRTHEDSWD